MFKTFACICLALIALASPAAAQIVPSATYSHNLAQTCDTTKSRCTLATPVVNPDGSLVGSAGGGAVTQSGTWTVITTPYSFTNITTNTDTVIKASPGTFGGLSINTIGTTSSVTVYNNTTCTGAKIGTYSTLVQMALTVNIAAGTGLCVTTAGAAAADITIFWR